MSVYEWEEKDFVWGFQGLELIPRRDDAGGGWGFLFRQKDITGICKILPTPVKVRKREIALKKQKSKGRIEQATVRRNGYVYVYEGWDLV
jgi:hypothetical protein